MTNKLEVRRVLEAHLAKYGVQAFRDECYLTIDEMADDGGHLIIEFDALPKNVVGKMVHLPNYQESLNEWIAEECRMNGTALTAAECIEVELSMNREHIAAIVNGEYEEA